MSNETPTSVRFDQIAKDRLSLLSKKTKIPVKTLIEMGVDWFLDQVDQDKSIPIPGERGKVKLADTPAPFPLLKEEVLTTRETDEYAKNVAIGRDKNLERGELKHKQA